MWDGTSCVSVGTLACGGEKFSLVLGIKGRASGSGTLAMITLGCSNAHWLGSKLGTWSGKGCQYRWLISSNFLGKLRIHFGLLVDEALDMLPGCMFEVIALAQMVSPF